MENEQNKFKFFLKNIKNKIIKNKKIFLSFKFIIISSIFIIIFLFCFLGFVKRNTTKEILESNISEFKVLKDKIHDLRFKKMPEIFFLMENFKKVRKKIAEETIDKINKQISCNNETKYKNELSLIEKKEDLKKKEIELRSLLYSSLSEKSEKQKHEELENNVVSLEHEIFKLEENNRFLEEKKTTLEKSVKIISIYQYEDLKKNLDIKEENAYKDLLTEKFYIQNECQDFIRFQDKFLEIKTKLIKMFYRRCILISIQNLIQFYTELKSFLKVQEIEQISESLEKKSFIIDIELIIIKIEGYLNSLKIILKMIQNENNIESLSSFLLPSFKFLKYINELYIQILKQEKMKYKNIVYDYDYIRPNYKSIKNKDRDLIIEVIEVITKKFPNEIDIYQKKLNNPKIKISRDQDEDNQAEKEIFLESSKEEYELVSEKEWCSDYIDQFKQNFPEKKYDINHISYSDFVDIFKSETNFRKYFFGEKIIDLGLSDDDLSYFKNFSQNLYHYFKYLTLNEKSLELGHFLNFFW